MISNIFQMNVVVVAYYFFSSFKIKNYQTGIIRRCVDSNEKHCCHKLLLMVDELEACSLE